MARSRKHNTENRGHGGWVDLIASAWIVLAGLFSLVAMAASAGMVAIQTGGTEVAFRCAFMVLLIGCVASAALRLTRRLLGEP